MAHESTRPASLPVLAAAFAVYSSAHLVNNTLLALDGPRQAIERLQVASGGWIEPVLVRSWIVLLAFLAVVVGLGKKRMADLGWKARDVFPGLLIYAGAWVALELGLAAWIFARGEPLELHSMWTRHGLAAVFGGVISQAFGHALVEDTAFRGFFLPELRARFLALGSRFAVPLLLALAVLASALLFGLAHLPTLALIKGSSVERLLVEQGHFLSAGLALGLAYLGTRNLFAVIGLHVLLNDPAPLFQVSGTTLNRLVLVVFALTVIAVTWSRRRNERAASASPAPSPQRLAA